MRLENNFIGSEIIIKENKFIIHPFTAQEAFRLQAVLMGKIGPAIGEALGAVDLKDIKGQDTEINVSKIGSAIEKLFLTLNEDDYWNLLKRIIKNTECIIKIENEKKKINLANDENIDMVFRKQTSIIFKLIVEILKVNYEDFFVLLEGIGNNIKTVLSNFGKEAQIKSLKK